MSDEIAPMPPQPLSFQRILELRVLADVNVLTEWCWVGPLENQRYTAAYGLEQRGLLERVREEPPCWRITADGRQALRYTVMDLADYWFDTEKGVQG